VDNFHIDITSEGFDMASGRSPLRDLVWKTAAAWIEEECICVDPKDPDAANRGLHARAKGVVP
jgi:hypothetical protein